MKYLIAIFFCMSFFIFLGWYSGDDMLERGVGQSNTIFVGAIFSVVTCTVIAAFSFVSSLEKAYKKDAK